MNVFSLRPLTLALGAALVLTACDAAIDAEVPEVSDLTEAEVAEATALVAEAVAEDGGGLVASARDLTAAVSASGMTDGRLIRGGTRNLRPPCRGDYGMTYNEETGTHTVGYRCGFQNAQVEKRFLARLSYRYRDAEGGFIARPWNDWDSVDSVAFDGLKEGAVKKMRGDSLRSESQFEQTGRWALSQLTDDTTPALLQGRQERTGTRIRNGANGLVSKSFSVQLSSEGIEIREGEDGLTHAASGEIAYVLTMEVTRGDRTETRTIEGTLVLDGSDRALMRVFGLRGVYRVSLASGETDREV